MKIGLIPAWRIGLAIVIFLSSATRARATLGESDDSLEKDRSAFSAVRRSAGVHTGYRVEEIRSDSTTIREYISASGVVFGLAWSGLTHPDLTQLLGSYATEYHEASRNSLRKLGRRASQVQASHVVVAKWGHMRNLQGRAYDPSLIPAGVSVDEIR